MEWIIGLIVSVVLIALAIIIGTTSKNNKGDYRDGGGTQVGGTHYIPPLKTREERAGLAGEHIVNRHLKPLLRNDEYLLANLLLPLKNGYKTEIDCVIVSRKGIFCIETKNWVGNIRGNDEDEYWEQIYSQPNRPKRQLKNPVRQNDAHCSVLEKVLQDLYDVENAVIFVGNTNIFGIDSDCVYTMRQFKKYYRNLDEDAILEGELKPIYQSLRPYVASQEDLEKHKRDLKKRFN